MFSTSVKVKVRLDHHDLPLEMKAIVVSDGMLMSHLKYLTQKKMKGRRDGWLNKSIQAVRYLLDYAAINRDAFDNPFDLFMAFSNRIRRGTIAPDGSDPSMLRWESRSAASAEEMILHVTMYSDWLCEQAGDVSLLLNPKRKASKSERLVNLAAYNHRINRAFLGHTYSKEHEDEAVNFTRKGSGKRVLSTFDEEKKPFDENKIWELIGTGFLKKGVSPNAPSVEKYNLANVLITMLMHFGSLRACEPFHLYKDDIIPNEGFEQIRVYHPQEGLAPEWYRIKTKQPHCNRSQFLKQKYGRTDRLSARIGTAYHAGWKNPPVSSEGKYFPVFLFGEPGVRELFYQLFKTYLYEQRVEPLKGREHPFLFTNRNGDPLSMDSYKTAHKNAVLKLGMSPYLRDGGSRHSHRHSYGQRLAALKDLGIGVDEMLIKGALHHKSLKSQKVYTEPHIDRIQEQLNKAIELTPSVMPVGMFGNFKNGEQ
jgi:hypothetical protein